jgi:hypothetical protein
MSSRDDSKSSKSFTLKLPGYKRPKLELWKHIDPNNMDTLLRCFEIDDYDEFMRRLDTNNIKVDKSVKLEQYKLFVNLFSKLQNLNLNDKRDLILIDLFYYLIEFALANAFNKEQINILISITHRTHELACESSFGNLDETFTYFKNFLVLYAVHRPPFSLNLLTPKQVELVLNYFLDTYFNQFKFFKFVYTPAVRLNLKFEYSNAAVAAAATLLGETGLAETAESEFKELDLADSMMNEDEERLIESRMTSTNINNTNNSGQGGAEKSAHELKEFVKKYLGQQVDKAKKDILTEGGELDVAQAGGKLPARKGSSKTNKTPTTNTTTSNKKK